MSGADIERKIVKYMVESQTSLQEDKANSLEESFSFEIEIEIGDGQSDIIFVDNQSDPKKLATQFCLRHSLENYIVQLLTASIAEKIEKAKAQSISERFHSQNEELRAFYGNTRPNEVLMKEEKRDITNSGEMKKSRKKEECVSQISKSIELSRAETKEPCQKVQEGSDFLGADKILMGSKLKKSKRGINEKENINDSQCQKKMVDAVSEQICRRMGKDNIISNCSKASKQRREKMLKEIEKSKEKELRECVFHPKINKISSKVALQLHISQEKVTDRHERLYENYKEIEMKKQRSRQNLLAEMSFKPSINHISSVIVSHKNSQVCLQDIRNISRDHKVGNMNKSDCNIQEESKNRPKTGRKPKSRNNQQLPIGQYLYNEAQRRAQKQYPHEKVQTVQALDKSERIVENIKEKRIQEIFSLLTPYPHEILSCEEINLSSPAFKKAPLKYFLPIFSEMIELGVSLNQNQFFQASLRMMKNLSPEQKHEIMKKEPKKQEQICLPPSLVSSKSRQLLRKRQYEQNSIYERGLMQRDQAREKATKGREERARQELLSCTFKPEVNRIELIEGMM